MSKLLTFHTLGGVAKRTSGLKLEGEKILRPTITPIYPPKRQRPSLSLQKNSTCRVPASSVSNLSLAIGFFVNARATSETKLRICEQNTRSPAFKRTETKREKERNWSTHPRMMRQVVRSLIFWGDPPS